MPPAVEVAPRTLDELLPRAALLAPSSGIIDVSGNLTSWPEVEDRVSRVAGFLAELGVAPGDTVAVLHLKSPESFIAMHAAIAIGAIAVPLDPMGTASGTAAVLSEVRPRALIGDAATVSRLITDEDGSVPTFLISGEVPDGYVGRAHRWDDALIHDRLPPADLHEDAPAYVIFTSGSTGRPKGIVHTHRSALAYAAVAVGEHRLDPSARLLATSLLHFDMSTLELYAVPWSGASTVTISEAELRFPATVLQRIERDRVTHLYAVVFLLRQLQQRGGIDQADLRSLRHVAYAGEHYPHSALAALMDVLPNVEFCNVYGPAEVNAVTTHQHRQAPTSDVPLGEPWPGVELRVEPDGELLVSAPTLMQGYWRRPDLTAACLVDRADGGTPWYRTGDIVEHDAEGGLVYQGRADNQIKVRGVRLEAEAIESVVADAPGVVHAVVGPIEVEGVTELCCHVVIADGVSLDHRAVQRWCRGRLPPMAIPTRFVVVPDFPLTASGKLDRRSVRESMGAADE